MILNAYLRLHYRRIIEWNWSQALQEVVDSSSLIPGNNKFATASAEAVTECLRKIPRKKKKKTGAWIQERKICARKIKKAREKK